MCEHLACMSRSYTPSTHTSSGHRSCLGVHTLVERPTLEDDRHQARPVQVPETDSGASEQRIWVSCVTEHVLEGAVQDPGGHDLSVHQLLILWTLRTQDSSCLGL